MVALARRCGFEIGRRWGEPPPDEGMPDGSAANAAGGFSAAPIAFDPPRSLLAGPCPPAGEERIELLVQTPALRLERIHSCAYSSPEGFWYQQPEEEWVLLLQGSAGLRFEDQPCDLQLRAGDSLSIRAGRRHRVTMTDPAPGTIWLALFWQKA